MSINPEAAVSYAALILADEGMEITPDKLQTLLKAASVEIEPIWSIIFSKALKDKNIKDILTTVQTSGPVGTDPTGENEKTLVASQEGVRDIVEACDSGSDIDFSLFE